MSLKKIHNIEALRKKLGCQTYEQLQTEYGYDVKGYFDEQGISKNELYDSDDIDKIFANGGYDRDGAYYGT